ncbi:MAG: MSMEG_0567/Sll0786 family nitrogen starvation N-acetyltransferase [Beijerinckiaceae bacterium]
MIFEPFAPFVASDFQVKFALEPWELSGAAALRRQVFCTEQKIFANDDADEIDSLAIPIVAIASLGVAFDDVVGTVRIHEAEPGIWWGSRLAVAPAYRRMGAIGTSLIKLAVSSAHGRGCRRFFAYVQSQNVLLFQRLHWTTLGSLELHRRPHHAMEADLSFYPPIYNPSSGFRVLPKKAA